LTTITVDTTPVKGYVTIRLNYLEGPIVAEGYAPVSAYVPGQWVACIQFGEVTGYIKPEDDCRPVFSDISCTYRYEPIAPKTYRLTIRAEMGGTTNPAPGTYEYGEGSKVTVGAIPDTGYVFDYWTLDSSRINVNPVTVTMDRDHTLIAHFKEAAAPPAPPPEWKPPILPLAIIAVGLVAILASK